MNATATLNPWDGKKMTYPQLVCWSCGKAAAVANIPDRSGALLVKLCSLCLTNAQAAIYGETLKALPRVEPRVPARMDSDDDGEPD